MNIAFYFSGKGNRVRKILTTLNSEDISELKLIICDNKLNEDMLSSNSYIFKSINIELLSVHKKERSEIFSNLLLDYLKYFKIDYLYCWGDCILKGELLTNYKNKIINFHPSILPLFPGKFSIDQAQMSNSILLGNTAHFIDEGIDTGPIIMQSVCHNSLFKRTKNYDIILDQQIIMFKKINNLLRNNKIKIINNIVIIDGISENQVSFFPNLE